MRLSCFLAAIFTLTLGSCRESIDIPDPPDMQPLLTAYANPTANVRAEVMAESSGSILDTQQLVEEAELPEQLLVLVEHLQNAIDSGGDESILVNGERVSEPIGAIRLNHVCSGWDEAQEADPEIDGTIELTLTLERGSIGPVVWGTFDGCRWGRTVGDRSIEVEYDGEIRAHFGSGFSTDTRVRDREITFEVLGTATLNGASVPIESSFRLDLGRRRRILDGRLEVLIEIESGEFFVFFFHDRELSTGVQDVTGRFFCNLEERRCERASGTFFW